MVSCMYCSSWICQDNRVESNPTPDKRLEEATTNKRSLRGNNTPISSTRLASILNFNTLNVLSMAKVADSVRSCRAVAYHPRTPGVVRPRDIVACDRPARIKVVSHQHAIPLLHVNTLVVKLDCKGHPQLTNITPTGSSPDR
jgi:hypothetical protein